MIDRMTQQRTLKHYTKVVLVIFVMSIINISVQMPAHAAMMQSMSNMDHSQMQQMDMPNCHCPPVLCDTVDAQQDQAYQNSNIVAQIDTFGFYTILSIVQTDIDDQLTNLSIDYLDWQYRQFSPPPISLTTELQI